MFFIVPLVKYPYDIVLSVGEDTLSISLYLEKYNVSFENIKLHNQYKDKYGSVKVLTNGLTLIEVNSLDESSVPDNIASLIRISVGMIKEFLKSNKLDTNRRLRFGDIQKQFFKQINEQR